MPEKKSYVSPSFVTLGSFEELTQQINKGPGNSDGVKYQGIPIGS